MDAAGFEAKVEQARRERQRAAQDQRAEQDAGRLAAQQARDDRERWDHHLADLAGVAAGHLGGRPQVPLVTRAGRDGFHVRFDGVRAWLLHAPEFGFAMGLDGSGRFWQLAGWFGGMHHQFPDPWVRPSGTGHCIRVVSPGGKGLSRSEWLEAVSVHGEQLPTEPARLVDGVVAAPESVPDRPDRQPDGAVNFGANGALLWRRDAQVGHEEMPQYRAWPLEDAVAAAIAAAG